MVEPSLHRDREVVGADEKFVRVRVIRVGYVSARTPLRAVEY
jgi:hypothetical protein